MFLNQASTNTSNSWVGELDPILTQTPGLLHTRDHAQDVEKVVFDPDAVLEQDEGRRARARARGCGVGARRAISGGAGCSSGELGDERGEHRGGRADLGDAFEGADDVCVRAVCGFFDRAHHCEDIL